jgi:hypothetical protein
MIGTNVLLHMAVEAAAPLNPCPPLVPYTHTRARARAHTHTHTHKCVRHKTTFVDIVDLCNMPVFVCHIILSHNGIAEGVIYLYRLSEPEPWIR